MMLAAVLKQIKNFPTSDNNKREIHILFHTQQYRPWSNGKSHAKAG